MRHSMGGLLLLLAAAAALARAPVAAALEGGPPPAPVRVEEVRPERVQDRRLVTGEVRAVRRALVATREEGLVLEVCVREGDAVAEGAVVARLDGELLRIALSELDAEAKATAASLEERRSEEAKAARDVESLRELARRDATNPREVADAESALRTAAARAAGVEAEAEVLAARRALLARRLADTVVKAPFAGTVTARRTEKGAWVGVGAPVVELASSGDLEAWLDVPQSQYGALAGGKADVEVRLDAAGESFRSRESRVVGDVDPQGRNFRVVVRVPSGLVVAPGMSVTAWVPSGKEAEHFLVSRDALLRNEAGSFLYAAAGGGEGVPASAQFVPVEVLFDVDDRSAIRSPLLRPGLQVVVEGNERLFPGAPLMPSPGDAKAGDGR